MSNSFEQPFHCDSHDISTKIQPKIHHQFKNYHFFYTKLALIYVEVLCMDSKVQKN